MLLQPAVASHESRHFERLGSVPLERATNISPLLKSHILPYAAARAQPETGNFDGNRTTVAPETPTVLEHGVLKWLHQPLRYKVTLEHLPDISHNCVHVAKSGTSPGEFTK